MSIVISNFAAISGYVAYCATIGLGSYGITRWASNGFEINSKDNEPKKIENDVNSAYMGFQYEMWKSLNPEQSIGLSDVESYNKFKDSFDFLSDSIFDDMKTLSSYKASQVNMYMLKEFNEKSTLLDNPYTNNDINVVIDSIEKTKKVFENDGSIMFSKVNKGIDKGIDKIDVNNMKIIDMSWTPNVSIYDTLHKSENLNTNLNGWSDELKPNESKPGEFDWSIMFEQMTKTNKLADAKPGEFDWSIMFEDYRKSIKEDLKNKNPNDILFANENVLAIKNEMSIALNLSPEEKDLHKENSDLYQMLIDNKKVYDEAITTIEGKYNINQIDGFKVKYFETNKEIIDQIDKNIEKLKELENNKKEQEVKGLAD